MLRRPAEGSLKGLEREDRPLPERSQAARVEAVEAVEYRIMARANVRPEEFGLKEHLARAKLNGAAETAPAAQGGDGADCATVVEIRHGC